MIFFSTCACVQYFTNVLKHIYSSSTSTTIYSMHRKLRNKRSTVIEQFRSEKSTTSTSILLCTDIVARGIDLPDVDWVIQYDPPTAVAQFVHRYSFFFSRLTKIFMKIFENLVADEQLASEDLEMHFSCFYQMKKLTSIFFSTVKKFL